MAKKSSDGGSGEEPSFSDAEWAEFERSFTKESTRTASYKEPSARQRELTEKWKKDAPKDTGWRNFSPRDEPSRGTTGGMAPGPGRPSHRRTWVRSIAWVLLAVLVTLAVIGAPKLFSSKGSRGSAGTPGTVGTVTATATARTAGVKAV